MLLPWPPYRFLPTLETTLVGSANLRHPEKPDEAANHKWLDNSRAWLLCCAMAKSCIRRVSSTINNIPCPARYSKP